MTDSPLGLSQGNNRKPPVQNAKVVMEKLHRFGSWYRNTGVMDNTASISTVRMDTSNQAAAFFNANPSFFWYFSSMFLTLSLPSITFFKVVSQCCSGRHVVEMVMVVLSPFDQ